jgi:photosystem II stability/assembly factor-like uncharacterized protein
MRIFHRFLATILIGISSASVAGPGVWTGNGPFGGVSRQIQVHPTNSNIVYAIGQSGMFRSDDAGGSWKRIENGLPAGIRWSGFFRLAPNNGNVIALYLGRNAPDPINNIYLSTTGGDRWFKTSYVFPATASRLREVSVQQLSSSNVGVAVLTDLDGPAGLSLSSNSGKSFQTISLLSGYPMAPRDVVGVVWSGNTIVASATSPPEVFRSTNNGASFSSVFTPPATISSLSRLEIAPGSAPTKIYLMARTSTATSTGFFSNNAGASWTAAPNLQSLSWISPNSPANLLQIRSIFDGDRSTTAIETSADSGVTSSFVFGSPKPTMAEVSGDNTYPTSSTLYAASFATGLFKSTNNGSTLTPINLGFDSVGVYSIASSSTTSSVLYAAQSDSTSDSHGVFKSVNAGSSWVPLDLTDVNASLIRSIAVDRTTPNTLYAVGLSQNRVLTRNHGVYKSTDAGANWTILGNGLPAIGTFSPIGVVSDVKLDPRSCTSPPLIGSCSTGPLRTVYITSFGNSVAGGNASILYKSIDGGANFTAANVGLPQPATGEVALRGITLAINSISTQTLYLGTFLQSTGTSIPGNYANGVFKSTNGGASWARSSNGLPTFPSGPFVGSTLNVSSIVIDPFSSSTLYAAVGTGAIDGSPLNGVFKSTDSGASWTNVSNGLVGVSIQSLAVDSSNAQTIYAAGTGTYSNPGGVFKTTNGGGVWRSISTGLPADAVFTLADGPGSEIRAGTNAGVYEFTQLPDTDRDGSIDTVENEAPFAGDGNQDGVPDREQSNVASFLIRTQGAEVNEAPRSARAPNGRSNHTSTTGENVRTPEGIVCDQIVDAYGIDPRIYPEDIGDDDIAYDASDRGLVSFEVPDCNRLRIIVRFHDGQFTDPLNWTWRNYGPTVPGDDRTLDWYTFPSAVQLDSERWRLTITAGQLGSYRSSNNSILFRGGPAFFPEHFNSGFEN